MFVTEPSDEHVDTLIQDMENNARVTSLLVTDVALPKIDTHIDCQLNNVLTNENDKSLTCVDHKAQIVNHDTRELDVANSERLSVGGETPETDGDMSNATDSSSEKIDNGNVFDVINTEINNSEVFKFDNNCNDNQNVQNIRLQSENGDNYDSEANLVNNNDNDRGVNYNVNDEYSVNDGNITRTLRQLSAEEQQLISHLNLRDPSTFTAARLDEILNLNNNNNNNDVNSNLVENEENLSQLKSK